LKWEKKGLIFRPDGSSDWARHTALQPTPMLMANGVIRVFIGMRDDEGVGRVGYVDVSASNPGEIIGVSQRPCLDIGIPGAFDDNGVIPCAVVQRDEGVFLYYAGYQLGHRVRFIAFSGLAVSQDNGASFTRHAKVPIIDRTDDEMLFRAIHSIMYDEGKWKAWYGAGSSFLAGRNKTLPCYNIRYMESDDGIHFPAKGEVVLDIREDEHRVGRPYVIKVNGVYRMFFGAGSEAEPYRLAYAESTDGIDWLRRDEELGISLSPQGWDSEMMAYPAVIRWEDKYYMFYNGNDYGKSGFGYAELMEW
jgi:sucrose-6-phosphate hydrolase SacC (GH32 family)